MQEKIQQVMSDQEFVKELLSLENAEDVQAKFAEKDIALSLDDIKLIKDTIIAKLESGSTELSEDDLETVAGGVVAETVAAVAAVVGCVIAAVAAIPSFIESIKRFRW